MEGAAADGGGGGVRRGPEGGPDDADTNTYHGDHCVRGRHDGASVVRDGPSAIWGRPLSCLEGGAAGAEDRGEIGGGGAAADKDAVG